MREISVPEVETLVAGLAAAVAGDFLCRRVRVLEQLTVPAPVVGGVLFSIVVAVVRAFGGIELNFASGLSEFLLLVFFTGIGLSAKLSSLKAGGKPLVILCAVTIALLVLQNLVGMGIALAWGAHPFYGLLVGSISFVGGPGTAAAWAKEAQAAGLVHAPEVGVAAATMAVITGAVLAGPITGWMIRRRGVGRSDAAGDVPWVEQSAQPADPAPQLPQVMRSLLLVMVAVAIGGALNHWARGAGILLPGFLTSMLAGVAISNGADLLGKQLVLGANALVVQVMLKLPIFR